MFIILMIIFISFQSHFTYTVMEHKLLYEILPFSEPTPINLANYSASSLVSKKNRICLSLSTILPSYDFQHLLIFLFFYNQYTKSVSCYEAKSPVIQTLFPVAGAPLGYSCLTSTGLGYSAFFYSSLGFSLGTFCGFYYGLLGS